MWMVCVLIRISESLWGWRWVYRKSAWFCCVISTFHRHSCYYSGRGSFLVCHHHHPSHYYSDQTLLKISSELIKSQCSSDHKHIHSNQSFIQIYRGLKARSLTGITMVEEPSENDLNLNWFLYIVEYKTKKKLHITIRLWIIYKGGKLFFCPNCENVFRQ